MTWTEEIEIKGIAQKSLARVRVPSDAKLVEKKKLWESSGIFRYWQFFMPLGPDSIEMRFFGIRPKDLGKKITALVQVSEWKERRKKTMKINVRKTDGQAMFRLKFPYWLPQWEERGCIRIDGCEHMIYFAPIYKQEPGFIVSNSAKPVANVMGGIDSAPWEENLTLPRRIDVPARHCFWWRFMTWIKKFF